MINIKKKHVIIQKTTNYVLLFRYEHMQFTRVNNFLSPYAYCIRKDTNRMFNNNNKQIIHIYYILTVNSNRYMAHMHIYQGWVGCSWTIRSKWTDHLNWRIDLDSFEKFVSIFIWIIESSDTTTSRLNTTRYWLLGNTDNRYLCHRLTERLSKGRFKVIFISVVVTNHIYARC